ncbi:MAG TPA: hypothetical protein VD789_03385 [Thermomicrobiales bacterium]|nr:hypothetical protein [Thermomicrobiales bacterium]
MYRRHREPRARLSPVGLLVVLVLALSLTSGGVSALRVQGTPVVSNPDCANGNSGAWREQMDTYASAGTYPAIQVNDGELTSTVMVELPAIEFTGEGQSATLPTGPCQHIYRYAYSTIEAPDGGSQPFAYVEIDWNTEGEPRGPNGSFVSPHFDFHFYLLPREVIERDLTCVSSNGKTCDGFLTDYEHMRDFQNMPEHTMLPEHYRPDVGSAIPAMGLHHLDMSAEYTVDAVNHTPVLIYGTFDGKIVFAEASVTLYTLQDAMAAPNHRITFPFHQPESFDTEIDWPTEFVIEYLPDTGGFRVGFAEFQHHEAD